MVQKAIEIPLLLRHCSTMLAAVFLGNHDLENKNECSKSHENWIKYDKSKNEEIPG
jgi:hypothetical protein